MAASSSSSIRENNDNNKKMAHALHASKDFIELLLVPRLCDPTMHRPAAYVTGFMRVGRLACVSRAHRDATLQFLERHKPRVQRLIPVLRIVGALGLRGFIVRDNKPSTQGMLMQSVRVRVVADIARERVVVAVQEQLRVGVNAMDLYTTKIVFQFFVGARNPKITVGQLLRLHPHTAETSTTTMTTPLVGEDDVVFFHTLQCNHVLWKECDDVAELAHFLRYRTSVYDVREMPSAYKWLLRSHPTYRVYAPPNPLYVRTRDSEIMLRVAAVNNEHTLEFVRRLDLATNETSLTMVFSADALVRQEEAT